MRTGLIKSKNLVSIRILQAIGPVYARDYVTKFGFDREKHGAYLTMRWEQVPLHRCKCSVLTRFLPTALQNHPYFIQRIEDAQGQILEQAGQ